MCRCRPRVYPSPPHSSSTNSVNRKPVGGIAQPMANISPNRMAGPNGQGATNGTSRSQSPAKNPSNMGPPPNYGYPAQEMPPRSQSQFNSPHQLGPTGANGLGDPFNPMHHQQSPNAMAANMNPVNSQYAGYPVPENQSFGNISPYPQAHPAGLPPTSNSPNMGPPPSALSYGGQMLPYADVMAMRKRDLQMYGPEYVRAMEKAPQVMAYREGPQRMNS